MFVIFSTIKRDERRCEHHCSRQSCRRHEQCRRRQHKRQSKCIFRVTFEGEASGMNSGGIASGGGMDM